jgi:hypothetical protein
MVVENNPGWPVIEYFPCYALRFTSLLRWLVTASAICQVTEANAPAVMADVAKRHQGWNPKQNSPGVSIKLTEVRRAAPHVIVYELIASGFPPGLKFTIVTWSANQLKGQAAMSGVTLQASGRAVCAGTPGTCEGNGPDDPIDLQFSPVKGEPIRLALISEDEKHLRAFVNFIPIPQRVSEKGCSLEEVMLAPNSALVVLQGSGYDPNADVQFKSESEGEHHDGPVKVDSDGNFYFALGQGVKGKERGTTKLSVSSPKCSLSLIIPWGKDTYQYE